MNEKLLSLLIQELKIGNAHQELTEQQWKEWAIREYDNYTNDSLKMVACHCMYNEEDNIEACLENDMKIVDLDAIHILDGAWEHGGSNPKTTDRTFKIIEKFKRKTDIPIIVESHPTGDYWESEGEKRNYQLKRVEELYPDQRVYAFIKDCDETIESNTGRQTYWLKGSFNGWYPDVAMLSAFAYNSSVGGDGCRFIPLGFGIHYYTEKTMVIHDATCSTIIDFNNDAIDPHTKTRVDQNLHKIFNFSSYRLVNRWNIRNKSRLKEKAVFDNFRVTQFNNTGKCKY